MSLTTWFGWNVQAANDELPDIFPLKMKRDDFVNIDIINIYSKILTDVIERTHGISEELEPLLWDNCLKSESGEGLLTMLSKAMSDKRDLFLIYDKTLKLIRIATMTESEQIKTDYAKSGESSLGVYISFKNYIRSDMIKLYSALEYCTVSGLNKSMNLSMAIQFKMSDLRGSVNLTDSADVKTQAQAIAKGLGNGKDVLLDAKDMIETAKPDLTSVKESVLFLNQKRSFYLGMPESYINGEQTGGLGSTGEQDTKAIERGLKNYYSSVIKPVVEAVFGIKVTYKSQDFRQITQALEALKTFSLVDEELISVENKTLIVNKLLDFDEDEKGTGPDPVVQPIIVAPGAKPPVAPPKGNA